MGIPAAVAAATAFREMFAAIGVGRVDERLDPLGREIGGEALGAAEAADPHGNAVIGHRFGTSGERHGRAILWHA